MIAEGFFNAVVTGSGKVYLQTMPICNVAAAIESFVVSFGDQRSKSPSLT
jgi:uncharacterized protein (AIM24 family)